MGADNSFYVKSIATYAPTFLGYIISVFAIVKEPDFRGPRICKLYNPNNFTELRIDP